MPAAKPPPGASTSYHQRYNRCGKADCPRCAPGSPGHGPYWYAYWREGGRLRSRYIGKQAPSAAQQDLHATVEPAASTAPPGYGGEQGWQAAGTVRPPTYATPTLTPQLPAAAAALAAPSLDTLPGPADALRVQTLGSFQLWRGEQPIPAAEWSRRKAAALCKALLDAPGHRLHRDQAMELLWPEADADLAASNLRSTLRLLRKILDAPDTPDSHVQTDGDLLVLLPHPGAAPLPGWWDAQTFTRAAEVALAGRDLAACRAALALYTGDYLPDDPYDDWALQRRERLHSQRLALLLHLAELYAAREQPRDATRCLAVLLELDPCQEQAARTLIRLQASSGRRTEAIRSYRRLVAALARDLAVEPEPATTALYAAILAGTPAGPVATLVGGTGASLVQPAVQPLLAGEARPLIGRQDLLAALQRHLELARAGRGRLVLVQGAAGSGKSRLLAEALRAAHQQGALVLFGHAYLSEGQAPYGSLHEALHGYLAAQDRTLLAKQCGDHVSVLVSLLPELAPLSPFANMARWIFDFRDTENGPWGKSYLAPPPPLEPKAERNRLFAALTALLQSICRAMPVVLALEDLHWADAATIEALQYLQRACRELPLLILATYRAEDSTPSAGLAALVEDVCREDTTALLPVDPLDEPGIHALVATLLAPEPVDEQVVTLVAEKSLGNPLFAGELVSALQEAGQVGLQAGQWRLIGDGRVATPPGIRVLIAARVGRLGARAGRLLRLCAVLTREAEYGVLRELSDLAEDALLDTLDQMIAVGLLVETARGYSFHHPLFAEAVYHTIATRRRALLHRQVAVTLEEYYGTSTLEHAAELAWHFGQAGSHQQAASYALAAGEHAAAAHATLQAIAQFASARRHQEAGGASAVQLANLDEQLGDLRLIAGEFAQAQVDFARARAQVRDPLRQVELWRKEGDSWERRGAFAQALAAYAAAEQACLSLPVHAGTAPGVPAAVQAAIEISRGIVYDRSGEHGAAELAATRALQLLEGAPESLDVARACDILGSIVRFRDPQRAAHYYRRSLAIRERSGDQRSIARSWNNLGAVASLVGEYLEAEACYHRSLERVEAIGDQWAIAVCLHNLAATAWHRGDFRLTEDYARRSLLLWHRVGDSWGSANAWFNLGNCSRSLGDYSLAEERYYQCLAIAERMGNQMVVAESWRGLGAVAVERGDYVAAMRHSRRARQAARRVSLTSEQIFAALGSARAYLRHPLASHEPRYHRVAAAFVRYAHTLTANHGQADTAVRVALVRAELQLRQGAVVQATMDAQEALMLSRSRRSHPEQAMAQRLLGQCALAAGTFLEAEAHLHAAWRRFEELGAVVDLARTRLVLAEVLLEQAAATDGPLPKPAQTFIEDARKHLQAAHPVFAARGAAADLAQAERLARAWEILV